MLDGLEVGAIVSDRGIGMTKSLHPGASDHLPVFITAPGGTDVLMVVMAVLLLVIVLAFGILFFRLHSLPERIAHRTHKIQFEIVAVLCLLALFTHVHLFWVAALLLAIIEFPDIGGWLGRIAGSVEKIAENRAGTGAIAVTAETTAAVRRNENAAQVPEKAVPHNGPGDAPVAVPTTSEQVAPASTRS
jgi:hypothetical protein